MTKEEFAALLNGREYLDEITAEEESQAKANGLLVIFGASDDLMEFRGADHDELSAYQGTIALIDGDGVLPDRNQIENDDELKYLFHRQGNAKRVDALWCKEDGYSWTFKTDVPHATFDIVEGDENYCRGIVISISDLPNNQNNLQQTAFTIADDAARKDVECFLVEMRQDYDGTRWYDVDDSMLGLERDSLNRSIEYLEQRKRIAHHPDNHNWVRVNF